MGVSVVPGRVLGCRVGVVWFFGWPGGLVVTGGGFSICPSRPSLAIVMDLVDDVLDDSSPP